MKLESGTFFSYSRDDSEFVLRLASDLRAAGHEVWLDQLDIKAGTTWDDAVQTALQSCQRMILVLSPASVESDNVADEISLALDENKTIIPVLLRECAIPLRIRRRQRVDFTANYDKALKRLEAALGEESGSATSVPARPKSVDRHPSTNRNRLNALIAILVAAVLGVVAWRVLGPAGPSGDRGADGSQTSAAIESAPVLPVEPQGPGPDGDGPQVSTAGESAPESRESEEYEVALPIEIRGNIFEVTATHTISEGEQTPGILSFKFRKETQKDYVDVVIERARGGEVSTSGHINENGLWRTQTVPLSGLAGERIKIFRWAPGFAGASGSGGGEAFLTLPLYGDVEILIVVRD